jgi:hypothetical protein
MPRIPVPTNPIAVMDATFVPSPSYHGVVSFITDNPDNEVKEADSEWTVTRTCMEDSGTAAQRGGLARSAIGVLLRAVKLRYGAVGPGICAQALPIGAGVDEEFVAAPGLRATAGAPAVAAHFGKWWATEYLEGFAGAYKPVIQEAGGQRARESASTNVRIPRGSSDQASTAQSCADSTSFPEGSFASGGVVFVADAPRGAGAVNGATGSKRARPGYDEHAAAMHQLSGSRAEADEDAKSSQGPQQNRTARAG